MNESERVDPVALARWAHASLIEAGDRLGKADEVLSHARRDMHILLTSLVKLANMWQEAGEDAKPGD